MAPANSIFPDVEWETITRPMANVTYVAIEGAEHGLLEKPGVLATIGGFLRAQA